LLDRNKSPQANFQKISEILQNTTISIIGALVTVSQLGKEISQLCVEHANDNRVFKGNIVQFLLGMGKES